MSYDHVADALYIKFSDGEVADSEEISEGVIIDYDQNGRVIGVEILNFSKRKIGLNRLIMMKEEEIIAEVVAD
ncbi:MAG: DUF2283 domain-containing protein [Candidatus Baldrarchaeia archaeon]